jgi:putative transport protein
MFDVLADNPVLTLFLVIAAGSLFGLIPFGPIRFGAAGALFVGLLLGALDRRLGEGLALVRTIGLALFVYTVGLASGPTLIRTFRRQAPMMIGSVAVLVVVGLATVVAGQLLGVGSGFLGGAYAGAGTSTPALAAAIQAARNQDPAVGYALSYPIGVILGILAVHLVMSRQRVTPKDLASAAAAGLTDLTVVVGRSARLADVPGAAEGLVRFSFWKHGGSVDIAAGRETVEPGDRIVIIGGEAAVTEAVQWLGARAHEHLAHDRRDVDYRRVLLSNATLSGSSVAELDIPGRYGGVVTRIRRGDLDLLARDELHVQLGDRLRVVVPRGRMPEVTRYLGDTERQVSEVDAVSLGLGLSLGFLVGLLSLPVGSVSLSLGVAAGPLIVGIVLGWLERTGPIVWSLPTGASATLRQLGLLIFLATVGLSSGPALATSIRQPIGVKLVLLAVVLAALGMASVAFLAGRLGMSPTRGGGLVAGFVGNPSLLAFANSKAADERVNEGYATLFVLDQVVKVLLVQVIVSIAS